MSPEPRTRSAVVTGGARGIGRAIASRLVAEGYAVVISDLDAEAAKRTAGEVGAVEAIGQDVTDELSHVEVARAAQAHRPLGLWVNNAGVGHDGTVADMDSAGVRALIDVNLLGVVWGSRAAVAAFREQAAGGVRGGEVPRSSVNHAHGRVRVRPGSLVCMVRSEDPSRGFHIERGCGYFVRVVPAPRSGVTFW